MFEQLILLGFGESISSPGLADGQRPCDLPISPTGCPSGPALPPASRSAQPASAPVETTPATSAPSLSIWSGPDAPLCCSASKSPARTLSDALQSRVNKTLERNLRGRGGTIYRFAWKRQVTPHGRRLFLLRASGHRTSGRDCSSAPSIFDLPQVGGATATTRDWKDGGNPDVDVPLNALLGRVAWLAGWPSPITNDATGSTHCYSGGDKSRPALKLPGSVLLAGWPTPMAGTPAQNGNNAAGNTDSSRKTVALAGWPTPQASDGSGGGQEKRALNPARSNDLMDFAMLAGWPTPTARDHFPAHSEEYIAAKKAQGHGMANLNDLIQLANGPARLTASGDLLTGSCAGMTAGGQLNPDLSRWLMGYPAAWGSCGATAMQSCRRRPRSSSPPAGKS